LSDRDGVHKEEDAHDLLSTTAALGRLLRIRAEITETKAEDQNLISEDDVQFEPECGALPLGALQLATFGGPYRTISAG
jgi:hypothetical protein